MEWNEIDRSVNLGRTLAVWLSAAFCGALSAGDSTTVVPYAQLAPALQKSIQAQLGGGTLGEINRDVEGGEVTYTVEITKGGRARDYTLDETGAVIGVEMTLQETPMPVLKTIQAQVGSGAIESIDRTVDGGQVSYDVDWKSKEGVSRSFTVLENGNLDSVDVLLEETPPAVKATITKEIGGGSVQEISKSAEADGVFYEVTVNLNGVDRDFTVAENGKLISRQVFLTEIPLPVQQTIGKITANGRVLRIDREFEKRGKAVDPFAVESIVDGKPYNFVVGPKGLFLGVDQ
jgi:uncharacterized membrane protein YkoI